MEGKAKARWIELCEQAATEQDSAKLLRLIREIDKLLREKHRRASIQRRPDTDTW
jgi:hypothetical protein